MYIHVKAPGNKTILTLILLERGLATPRPAPLPARPEALALDLGGIIFSPSFAFPPRIRLLGSVGRRRIPRATACCFTSCCFRNICADVTCFSHGNERAVRGKAQNKGKRVLVTQKNASQFPRIRDCICGEANMIFLNARNVQFYKISKK